MESDTPTPGVAAATVMDGCANGASSLFDNDRDASVLEHVKRLIAFDGFFVWMVIFHVIDTPLDYYRAPRRKRSLDVPFLREHNIFYSWRAERRRRSSKKQKQRSLCHSFFMEDGKIKTQERELLAHPQERGFRGEATE